MLLSLWLCNFLGGGVGALRFARLKEELTEDVPLSWKEPVLTIPTPESPCRKGKKRGESGNKSNISDQDHSNKDVNNLDAKNYGMNFSTTFWA